MKVLFDTHAFLWWLLDDPRLSTIARSIVTDRANDLYLSSASGIEIAAKSGAGKLRLPLSAEKFVQTAMRTGHVIELPISLRHTYHLERLPMIHRDPFDRLLIGTAIEEQLAILTSDREIVKYPVATLW